MQDIVKRKYSIAGAIALFLIGGTVSEAGWFETATGIKTPEPIRKIAPKGLSWTPKPEPTSRVLPVDTPSPTRYDYQIDQNSGMVTRLSYSGNTLMSRQHVGYATLKYGSDGWAYFEYGNRRVQANRPRQQQMVQFRSQPQQPQYPPQPQYQPQYSPQPQYQPQYPPQPQFQPQPQYQPQPFHQQPLSPQQIRQLPVFNPRAFQR